MTHVTNRKFALSAIELTRIKARFAATTRVDNTLTDFHSAAIVSSADVPRLLNEVECLRRELADLVAGCRAGLLAHYEGDPASVAWLYVTDVLAPAPPGHPLHTYLTGMRGRAVFIEDPRIWTDADDDGSGERAEVDGCGDAHE